MADDRHDYVDSSQATAGKTMVAYPTPSIKDLIVTEDIQTRPEEYEPLPIGTPHPKNEVTGLDLRLVWQGPVKGNDAYKAVRRVYATPRSQQDFYNYGIKYAEESPSHPIYIRRYVVPREGYKPLPERSALDVDDPLNISGQANTSVLVKEELQPLDGESPEIASLFVRVVRIYETLPGPILTTKRLGQESLIPAKYRRLIRTVETNQTVAADYEFPAGLTGDQTFIELAQQAIATARLKIIEEHIAVDESPLVSGKTGEFGNLVINEEVVDEGTLPLSGQLIQDSQVTALGNGKAIRITVRYPDDLLSKQKFKKTIGQPSLIPEKYRRLIRTVETEQPVPVDYAFPTELTGDQTFIEFAQQTITEARLKIIEEVIAADESPLVGGKTGEFGNLIINEEVVEEGTLPLTGQLIQNSTVTALGNGKSIRITVRYPDNLLSKTKVKKTIGQPSLIPEKYRRLIRTVETEQPVPVDYTFPTELTGDQSFIEFAQQTITEARLKITEEVINADESPLLGGETDEYGELRIYESVVEEGAVPDTGFLWKTSRVTPLGNGKAIKISVKYPEDLGDIVLADSVVDEKEGIVVGVERRLVPAGTSGGVDSDGAYREVKALDRWRSIQIASKLDLHNLPEPEPLPGTRRISLPDELIAITAIYGKTTSNADGESGGDSPGISSSVHAMVDGVIVVKVRNGFRGSAKSLSTRQFFDSPPLESMVPSPTIIKPTVGTAYMICKGGGASLSLAGGGSPHANSGADSTVKPKSLQIGPALTGNLTFTSTIDSISIDGVLIPAVTATASGLIGYEIDASTPATLPAATEIVEESNTEKWRFSIYVLEYTIVKVP